MTKLPTSWSSNPAKNTDSVLYSSASVTYSSGTVRYSSSTVSSDEFNKTPGIWTRLTKTASNWQANPASHASEYVYNSTALYDSATRTYDGVVSGQDLGNQNTPTRWTAA